jgi:hypothetical protein
MKYWVLLCSFALALSAVVISVWQTAPADSSGAIIALQNTVSELQGEYAALQQKYNELQSRLADTDGADSNDPPFSNNGSSSFSQDNVEFLHETLSDVCESLFRLEYIVDSAGLDSTVAAANKNLLQAATGTTNSSLVKAQILDQFAKDTDRYGNVVMDLYSLSRVRWNPNGDNTAREEAFKTLVEEYPDAYVTAMVVAERAIGSGLRGKVKDVEAYYKLLSENEFGGTVITERGIEAMPAMEYYLARYYISKKRYADAQPLINSLQENYTGGKIYNIAAERRWQSGQRAVNKLNRLKKNATKSKESPKHARKKKN